MASFKENGTLRLFKRYLLNWISSFTRHVLLIFYKVKYRNFLDFWFSFHFRFTWEIGSVLAICWSVWTQRARDDLPGAKLACSMAPKLSFGLCSSLIEELIIPCLSTAKIISYLYWACFKIRRSGYFIRQLTTHIVM